MFRLVSLVDYQYSWEGMRAHESLFDIVLECPILTKKMHLYAKCSEI